MAIFDLDWGVFAGYVRPHDSRALREHPNGLEHAVQGQAAVAPIGESMLGGEAVFVDGKVYARSGQAVDDATDE